MSEPKEITKADAHVAVHVRGLASDFAAAKEIASHREWAAYAERVRILDAVKAAANNAPSPAREMLLDAIAVLRGVS